MLRAWMLAGLMGTAVGGLVLLGLPLTIQNTGAARRALGEAARQSVSQTAQNLSQMAQMNHLPAPGGSLRATRCP